MKNDNVKIDQELNQQIWKRGKTNPPRKIRIKMSVDDNMVLVSSYQDLIIENDTDKK